MMMERSVKTALLMGGLIMLSWIAVTRLAQAADNQLSEAEAIKIAEQAATAEGFDLAKYDRTGCHYEYTKKDKTWTVFYQLKPPTPPGGHFLVSVDDRTKKAMLHRGE
jgi:hypothetical protein